MAAVSGQRGCSLALSAKARQGPAGAPRRRCGFKGLQIRPYLCPRAGRRAQPAGRPQGGRARNRRTGAPSKIGTEMSAIGPFSANCRPRPAAVLQIIASCLQSAMSSPPHRRIRPARIDATIDRPRTYGVSFIIGCRRPRSVERECQTMEGCERRGAGRIGIVSVPPIGVQGDQRHPVTHPKGNHSDRSHCCVELRDLRH